MSHYLRAHVAGGSYFFTVALLERRRRLLTAHIDALRAAFRSVHTQRPFRSDAMVILPYHLHCIWTLPAGRCGFLDTLALDQIVFLPRGSGYHPEGGRNTNGAFGNGDSWSTRRDQRDFDAHLDYIHFNPVKHGWVSRVADWPRSSFHRYARSGCYPLEWAPPADVREWAGVTARIANGGLRDEAANPPCHSSRGEVRTPRPDLTPRIPLPSIRANPQRPISR